MKPLAKTSGQTSAVIPEAADDDRALFRAVKRRADKARNFPVGTDPASRHVYIMADCMVKKRGYPMLVEEPWHCAISLMATVAALWEARKRLEKYEPRPAASGNTPERSKAAIQDRYDRLARAGQFDQGDHPPKDAT